jgi:monoamine oxidase
MYVPNWSNDEWTFGSWEKWQTGRSVEDFDEFTKPLVNKHSEKVVYLSGSATCNRYDGWVHRALLSGEQSATEVMHDLGLPAT